MKGNEYIEKLQIIRKLINSLTDELYEYKENRELFSNRNNLFKQIIFDILYGYENE